jgi:hypothetical protein
MKLTKPQRETLRLKYQGLCAYCGKPLGDRWHADHIERVERKLEMVRDGYRLRVRATGQVHRPERDTIDNLNPACVPCNIDKGALSLNEWRKQMERSHEVLQRDNGTYRRMLRYGMVLEERRPIVFHFEREELRCAPLTRCAADSDGDCNALHCPQLRDGEPAKSHRCCPLPGYDGENE